jgi:hypothetical protein
MAFTPADEHVIRSAVFRYIPDGTGESEIVDERTIERANAALPPVANQVCDALRSSIDAAEEVRELRPMLSFRVSRKSATVRIDVLACTDRQVHLVFAGSDTAVDVRRFSYGVLDADTKVFKLKPELTEKNGRPLLIVPRSAGKEARFDQMLAAPPTRRNPELPTEAPASPPGWHADPTRRHQLRWWDGRAWTANAADAGTTVHDPLT